MTKTRRGQIPSRCATRAALCAVAVLAAHTAAWANQGLVATAGEWLWPQLQARITIQTAALSPMALTRVAEPVSPASRSVQGGAILGDYVFATPGFGNFRATSGVMLGGAAGAPVLYAAPTARVGVTVLDGAFGPYAGDAPSTLPYLGLGYSSARLWRSFSVSADVGMVAGRPAGVPGLTRAVFGSQPTEAAVRDLRLAPVLQLGVRYNF